MKKSFLLLTIVSSLLVGCVTSPTGVSLPKATTPETYNLSINKSLMVPEGKHARHTGKTFNPTAITIHSTQNYHRSADARKHALAQFNGALKSRNNKLGYVSWHYSVDDSSVYQSLPDNVEAQHADYEGPGNKTSLGIEMCENAGNSQAKTIDQTARLCAYLIRKHRISIDKIHPHRHWRMIRYSDGKDLGHKNCPHFLLDGGNEGPKWEKFKAQIQKYLDQ